jgi:hypothetical protein
VTRETLAVDHRNRLNELDRLAICEWLRRHGIDANGVPIPNRIVRDEEARTVTLDLLHGFTGTTASLHLLSECPDRTQPVSRREDDACTTRTVIVLEGRPMPFPEMTE